VVAVASATTVRAAQRQRRLGWTAASVVVLLAGLGARLVLGGFGVGDLSAVIMTALLGCAAWLAARVLGGRRSSCSSP
jgi:hypothetical protein